MFEFIYLFGIAIFGWWFISIAVKENEKSLYKNNGTFIGFSTMLMIMLWPSTVLLAIFIAVSIKFGLFKNKGK